MNVSILIQIIETDVATVLTLHVSSVVEVFCVWRGLHFPDMKGGAELHAVYTRVRPR